MLTPMLLSPRRCCKGALSAHLSSGSVVSRPEGCLSRQAHLPLPVGAASHCPPQWDESKTDKINQPAALLNDELVSKWLYWEMATWGRCTRRDEGVCEFGFGKGAACGWHGDTPFLQS